MKLRYQLLLLWLVYFPSYVAILWWLDNYPPSPGARCVQETDTYLGRWRIWHGCDAWLVYPIQP